MNITWCPLSVKDIKNKPINSNFDKSFNDSHANESIFLSKKNIYNMIYYIIALNKLNKTDHDILQNSIPIKMQEWADKNSINDFEDLTNNIFTKLTFLNKKFLTENGHLFDLSGSHSINVFHIKSDTVTDRCGKLSNKKYDEMLAQDYHTIDVHQSMDIFKSNANFRYDNDPKWEKNLNTRHYDRSNDGLHTSSYERASLNNQIHGYDMSEIYKGTEYYENHYYENL